MKKYPFYAALSQCSELYGVELDEDTFETFALSAWLKIGNKDFKMYVARLIPECDSDGGYFVCLPCNCDTVEAVTSDLELAKITDNKINHPGMYSLPIEQNIEYSKRMPSEFYIPGAYVKYKELGNRLYFTEKLPAVNVLYKGIYADEDGLPYLNDKELDAIAAYCAYIHDYKQARITKDGNLLQLALAQHGIWLKSCMQARIPMSISQNAMSEIIKVTQRWDTPNYALDWKPIL